MFNSVLNNISFITVLSIATVIIAIIFYRNTGIYHLLLTILFVSVITELMSLYDILNKLSIISNYNIYFILHQGLWLLLIIHILGKRLIEYSFLFLFILLSLLNILYYEKENLNYLTFVLGSFVYLGYFIYKNFLLLNEETREYFLSERFLLLSSPILFFFALTFILGFRDSDLRFTKIKGYYVYTILSTISNTIYYLLLIIYIFRTRVNKYARLTHD